ncbi:MAG TPA: molybdopterin-synthase adenylyltransferase MoeB [Gammaproteobacteria bacterium]|nr:molybdopterin-synthase adenylyltransferase MoeB [Gammaproteobacteria bacterium]
MNDLQLLRYSRHLLLPNIDIAGQEKLLDARVLIIGLGGLGSPVAMYLAAAGVGTLVLVDHDTVELSNLQRQIVHAMPDLKRPKVESARDRLLALNPEVRILTLARRLDGQELFNEVDQADVTVDCTDNFASRFAANAACVRARKPLVYGAAIRFEGQVAVFHPAAGGPCYRCLYNDDTAVAESCSQTGVVAPLLGIIGSLQATEALKLIVGIDSGLIGRLLLLDGLRMEWNSVIVRRDPHCPVCA